MPRSAGTERLDAGCFQIVDDAGAERRFRADHDQIDAVQPAERDHRGVVGEIERYTFGLARGCRHCLARR